MKDRIISAALMCLAAATYIIAAYWWYCYLNGVIVKRCDYWPDGWVEWTLFVLLHLVLVHAFAIGLLAGYDLFLVQHAR